MAKIEFYNSILNAMKIPKLPLVVLLSMLLLTHITCKKDAKNLIASTPLQTTQLEKAPKQPDGPKNYCQGCGNSTDPHFGCLIVDVINEGIPPIQCSMKICPGGILEHYDSVFQNPNNLNSNDAYHIRQKLLETNEKFRLYMTYADVISRVMIEKNTVTFQNLSDHITTANLAIDACMRYIYGASNELIVTQELYVKGIALIQYYKVLHLGEPLDKVLVNIENDLNKFKGLSKNQIAVYVEN
jgi:hypothetical protein